MHTEMEGLVPAVALFVEAGDIIRQARVATGAVKSCAFSVQRRLSSISPTPCRGRQDLRKYILVTCSERLVIA
jgi:hypothetical protein